jgi:hypothetical protein
MAEAHVGLGEVPPGNYQQFIDKGTNEEFVCLVGYLYKTAHLQLDYRKYHPLAEVC